jgi:hypothetical protein
MFVILSLLLVIVDPATYVGNIYGRVTDSADCPVSGARIEVFDSERLVRSGRSDERGEFLINSVPAPYDGRDYTIRVADLAPIHARVLPGAVMALEIVAQIGGKMEWRYRHETPVRTPAPHRDDANYTRSIFATREGLVGGTTANGHVIVPNDRFAALPSRRALSTNFGAERQVRVSYRGRTTIVPVWDIGPWNIHDDYWSPTIIRETFKDLPRGKPEAQAAFLEGYNGGLDERGRVVRTPAGIDLADGTFWIDLALIANDWVDVEYLWLDSVGPTVTALIASPNPVATSTTITLDATVTDDSPIAGAEFFVDKIGPDGSGIPATAADGAFDSPVENARASLATSDWLVGATHTIYAHAQDVYGNWGPAVGTVVTVVQPPSKRRAVRR